MVDEDFWDAVRTRERRTAKSHKTGVLNIALLFGMVVIALSLIVTPMLSGNSDKRQLAFTPDDFDNITTGSIDQSGQGRRYTIRRSILQEMPGSVCIISGDDSGGRC
ncbi:hypothetical protein ACQQ2Q_16985 [Agrobacterium sp. ES01]|uniref:hypothetical protein n=1 Tax=Agrobacterium sp. ES01 TaxID=3420714 RepID=UPI003D0ECBF0